MKIKQVVVLADQAQVAGSRLPGLEQLGLPISDRYSGDDDGKHCLLLCAPEYEKSFVGSVRIRQALADECAVLLDGSNCTSVLEEIRQTGGLSLETRNNLEARNNFCPWCLGCWSGDGIPEDRQSRHEPAQAI